MGSVKVVLEPNGKTAEASRGERLLDIAALAGVGIDNLCGGQGVCGKCKVKMLEGHVHFPGKYIGLLDKNELEAGYVLACQAETLDEDVKIWVPQESRKEGDQILTVDHIVHYGEPAPIEKGPEPFSIPYFQPLCQKHYLKLPRPSLSDNLSDMERIYRELRKKLIESQLKTDFSCLRNLARVLRQNDWSITATLHMRNLDCPRIRAIEAGDTSTRSFGVAIDLGTTTIVAQLIDLRTGAIVGVEGSHNSQARYGEDVISRMIFACGRGGLPPLTEAVITTINSLVQSLVGGAGIDHRDISCFVAAGNTTMTHLLLGLEPCAIRIEPYIPTATRFPYMEAREIGLFGHPKAVIHCMPCVSGYVGGDITAGVLACGMNDQPLISALIDVGTNGEIVIGNSEWLVCCSASAGPAFEGGGTRCGMRATKGAIEKIRVRGEDVFYEAIGGAKPRGICGSGLIDVIAELVAEGIIDQGGKFIHMGHPRVQVTEDIPEFVVARPSETETGQPVVVTEDDISNLIKSKGAILAAMRVLLHNMGMSFQDLSQIYVAGGFGAHLDIEKAIFVGLLPDIPKERIRFIGNSSLAGARLGLLSTHAFNKAEAIAKHMTYFELSVHPEFMNEFVASLFLPHTQMELFPSVGKALAQRRKNT
jgi:uncharacterized 2Fe-2S/4Fe-4S cluster protein (DUF4445 family)